MSRADLQDQLARLQERYQALHTEKLQLPGQTQALWEEKLQLQAQLALKEGVEAQLQAALLELAELNGAPGSRRNRVSGSQLLSI